jgi:hypothetical protein
LNFRVIETLVESLSRDARLIYALASLALWASPGDHWITLNWQHSCYFLPWSSRKLSAIELSSSCQPNMSTEQARLSCSTLHVESRIIPTNILPRSNIRLPRHTLSNHPPLQFWANPSGQPHSFLNSSSGSDLAVSSPQVNLRLNHQ